jgi:hypothetical protein
MQRPNNPNRNYSVRLDIESRQLVTVPRCGKIISRTIAITCSTTSPPFAVSFRASLAPQSIGRLFAEKERAWATNISSRDTTPTESMARANGERQNRDCRSRARMTFQGGNLCRGILTPATLAFLLVASSVAKCAPANSLRELYVAVGACVEAPAGPPGSEVTIVFSLKRDGALLGKPRISHAKLFGDANDQRQFIAGVLAAFGRCLPVSVTEGLGGAIAGRPMSFRVVSRPRETISKARRNPEAPANISQFERPLRRRELRFSSTAWDIAFPRAEHWAEAIPKATTLAAAAGRCAAPPPACL